MIEQAYISGRLGKAIYEDGGRYFVMETDTSEPIECRPMDFSAFFGFGAEVKTVSTNRIDVVTLRSQLQILTKAQHALTLIISAMDGELDLETRSAVIGEAESLLNEDKTHHFVRSRLLSRPLPQAADITMARDLAIDLSAVVTATLYQNVIDADESTEFVQETWNETAVNYFSTFEDQARATEELIDLGAFADITTAIARGDLDALNSLVVTYAQKAELKGLLRQVSLLLNDFRKRLFDKINLSPAGGKNNNLERDEPSEEDASIEAMLSHFKKRRDRRRSRVFGAEEAKERVDHQIEAISELIVQGNLNLTNRYLTDLIGFHVRHSQRKHLGMSLCSLAKVAIDSKYFDLAERMVNYALALGVDDVVILNTHAELMKSAGKFNRALAIYKESMECFPNSVVARNGYAEVLKVTGAFDEALAVYEETMERFPSDEVARTSYAEVLKATGEFDDALSVYEKTMERFPNNVVARNGYAEVLKATGKFDEALAIYKESMKRFPNNVVARNGYAEVLKVTGAFDEALAVYEETMERFPSDEVARISYAEVLKATGEFDEALAVYKESMKRFPNNEVAHNGYAEVLKATGEFDEALAVYEETMERFPSDEVARNGYAEVLKATGAFDEALAIYRKTMERFPNSEVARNGYAEVLKATGEFDEALAVYEETRRRFPNNVVACTGYAEALKATGEFDEALAVYEETMERFPNNVVACSGYAEVLKATGEFDEALAVYEETVERFPNSEVARNGYAEVLKATGEFEKAFAIYGKTMERFPNSVVAYSGYAEALKAAGDFDEALAVYEETMERFPNSEVARNGYAEVLKATGEFKKAFAVYEKTIERFPNNVVALCGYAELLKTVGEFDQALTIYGDALRHHKYNRVSRSGYASMLVILNRFEEVRSFLSHSNPRSKDDWIDYHILAMSYLKQGNLDRAIAMFTFGQENAPYTQQTFFINGLAVAKIRKREFDDVIRLLEPDVSNMDIIQRETRLALIGHSHAALGKKEEANHLIFQLNKTRNPRVINLKDAILQRYGLDKRSSQKPLSASEASALDVRIQDQEYFLAEAA